MESEHGRIGYRYYDGKERAYFSFEKREGIFHGCGDVFASSLAGYIVKGARPAEAVRACALFTEHCIERTIDNDAVKQYGLCFEECLGELTAYNNESEVRNKC